MGTAFCSGDVVEIDPGQGRHSHADVSHDGTWVATLGEDGSVRLCHLQGVEQMVAQTCRRVPRNFRRPEWTRLFPGRPYRHTCPALGDPPPEPQPVQAVG